MALAAAQLLAHNEKGEVKSRSTLWRASEFRAILLLIVIAIVGWGIPALFGHPPITRDNLIQNLPLRALVGSDLRHGAWPFWNPTIWSGTPLLGGMNAGAFYPFTFFFVFLSPITAFVVNLILISVGGSVGLYLLARTYGLGVSASLLGAICFEVGGASAAQSVHLGVAQGISWLPWLILASLRLGWARIGRGEVALNFSEEMKPPTWPWVALLAVVIAMIGLTGEPRAMAYAEVVVPVVVLWMVLSPTKDPIAPLRRRFLYVVQVVIGVGWGIALSAVQLEVGARFTSISQRASATAGFFGSGSLPKSWTTLLFVPDLFGGGGAFSQTTWFNHYSLAEVTGYLGLVGVGAFFVLVVFSIGRFRLSQAKQWGLFLVLGLVGLVLAYGSYTPLAHLLIHLPLYGLTRLQSRNLAIVDLSLAMCLAFFVDVVAPATLSVRPGEQRGLPSSAPRANRWARMALGAPALIAISLMVAVLVAPVSVEETFGATALGGAGARDLWPLFLIQGVVALSLLGVALWWRRLARSGRLIAIWAIVIVDLGFFLISSLNPPYSATTSVGLSQHQAALIRPSVGRIGIFDTKGTDLSTLASLGQPDSNDTVGINSVQGYGSIVATHYASATGTHRRDTLDLCALASGTFSPLQLHTLYVTPTLLAPQLTKAQPLPTPVSCSHSRPFATPRRRKFFFGREIRIWTVRLGANATGPLPSMKLGLIKGDGEIHYPQTDAIVLKSEWMFRLVHPQDAVGIVVVDATANGSTKGAELISEHCVVNAIGGNRYELNGVAQEALDRNWHPRGFVGTYARFVTHVRTSAFWVKGKVKGVHLHVVSRGENGEVRILVKTRRPVTLLRSEAYDPGWRAAFVSRKGGEIRSEVVGRSGLIQSLRVPKGAYFVTFSYVPPGWRLGELGSGVGIGALIGSGIWYLLRRRRTSGWI
jgi:hypothetical protein